MQIREATEADIPRLIEMAVRFLLESRYGETFDNAATPDAIGRLVRQVLTFGTIFVAENDIGPGAQAVVGMLAIVIVPHPLTGKNYADEIAWWVEPNARGGTIGPKMLRAAEQWATTNGANMVKMVAPSGTSVGEFYEKLGYEVVETAYIKTI